MTWAHGQFLFVDDGNADKILMFTTARNLTDLIVADIIYGDDTLFTSPTQFTQLYTLHAMVGDVMYSLVFNRICGVIVSVLASSVVKPNWQRL